MGDADSESSFLKLPLVYVAAPYTRPDPVANTHVVIKEVDAMASGRVVTPLAPHLTLLWHLVAPRELEFWYEYDIALLARCDALLRLPGESTGADREVAFAEERGVPVFSSRADLYEWAAGWTP